MKQLLASALLLIVSCALIDSARAEIANQPAMVLAKHKKHHKKHHKHRSA